jgi:hypothetical protein
MSQESQKFPLRTVSSVFFVNLINMNLPHNRLWSCSDRNLDRFQNLHTSLYRIVIRVDDLQINRPFLGDLLCGKSLC